MTRILSSAEIGRLVSVTAQLGPWAMPVVSALRDGLISVQFLRRTERAPLGEMRRSPLPLLVWVGDDDDDSCGPDGWRPALAATHWARAGIVHAAGGEAKHYATAVAGTLIERRFILIETASRHAMAWAKLMAGKPMLGILPQSGPHPVQRRETRH